MNNIFPMVGIKTGNDLHQYLLISAWAIPWKLVRKDSTYKYHTTLCCRLLAFYLCCRRSMRFMSFGEDGDSSCACWTGVGQVEGSCNKWNTYKTAYSILMATISHKRISQQFLAFSVFFKNAHTDITMRWQENIQLSCNPSCSSVKFVYIAKLSIPFSQNSSKYMLSQTGVGTVKQRIFDVWNLTISAKIRQKVFEGNNMSIFLKSATWKKNHVKCRWYYILNKFS